MSDLSKTNELIAEGRAATACRCVDAPEQECGTHGDGTAKLIGALVDALEAATRVPVQGEPSDDREALANILLDAREAGEGLSAVRNRVIDAGFSRAVVPDAATEAFDKAVALSERRQTLLEETEAERDAATAELANVQKMYDRACADIQEYSGAIERVREAIEKHKHWSEECGWDVPTIEALAALDGAPEPAPVMPSSTVDEIAEVIGEHLDSYTRFPHTHEAWHGCTCGEQYLGEIRGRNDWMSKHRASAVVEAIGGERR